MFKEFFQNVISYFFDNLLSHLLINILLIFTGVTLIGLPLSLCFGVNYYSYLLQNKKIDIKKIFSDLSFRKIGFAYLHFLIYIVIAFLFIFNLSFFAKHILFIKFFMFLANFFIFSYISFISFLFFPILIFEDKKNYLEYLREVNDLLIANIKTFSLLFFGVIMLSFLFAVSFVGVGLFLFSMIIFSQTLIYFLLSEKDFVSKKDNWKAIFKPWEINKKD